MHAEIYIGCVYYQRLRHMVSDKSQVRVEISSVTPTERTCSLSPALLFWRAACVALFLPITGAQHRRRQPLDAATDQGT